MYFLNRKLLSTPSNLRSIFTHYKTNYECNYVKKMSDLGTKHKILIIPVCNQEGKYVKVDSEPQPRNLKTTLFINPLIIPLRFLVSLSTRILLNPPSMERSVYCAMCTRRKFSNLAHSCSRSFQLKPTWLS